MRKTHMVTMGLALVAVAVANRIPQVRAIING